MRAYGHKVWVFPDGYAPARSTGALSHECVSVLNTGERDAHLTLTAVFQEEREPLVFRAVCPAMRSRHVRLDRLVAESGEPIPKESCYSLVVESDEPVTAQYSRLDTSAGGMGLCTLLGHREDL